MEHARSEKQLVSTPFWAVSVVLRFFSGTLFWGIFMLAASSLAIFTVPDIYPAAEPFVWLTIVGLVLMTFNARFSEEEADRFVDMLENINERERRDRLAYLSSLMMLLILGVSFQVAIVASTAAVLALEFSLGLAALVLVIFYPMFDAWLGREISWNLASVGATIGLVVMWLIAFAYSFSFTIPRQAAHDLRYTVTG